MYVEEGAKNDSPPLPLTEDLDIDIRKQLQEASIPMEGILVVNIIMARNLRAADILTKSSDPYTKIIFPNGLKLSSPVISQCLNPVWNFQARQNISITKEVQQTVSY